jgi:hypothetical protein
MKIHFGLNIKEYLATLMRLMIKIKRIMCKVVQEKISSIAILVKHSQNMMMNHNKTKKKWLINLINKNRNKRKSVHS